MPEFEILVTRFGNTAVYRRAPCGRLTFWSYARSIPAAISAYKHWPVRITAQGTAPNFEGDI